MVMHSVPDGLCSVLASGRPYLGDPVVVDRIVRDFGLAIILLRQKQNAGQLNDQEAQLAVMSLAADAAAIFLGRSAAYSPMKWNSERRLGILLRTHYPQIDGVDSGVAAFVWLANQVLAAAIDAEFGRDDVEIQHEMTAVFESFERIMLGSHLPDGADH